MSMRVRSPASARLSSRSPEEQRLDRAKETLKWPAKLRGVASGPLLLSIIEAEGVVLRSEGPVQGQKTVDRLWHVRQDRESALNAALQACYKASSAYLAGNDAEGKRLSDVAERSFRSAGYALNEARAEVPLHRTYGPGGK